MQPVSAPEPSSTPAPSAEDAGGEMELERTESKTGEFIRFEAEEVAAAAVQAVNDYCTANQSQFVDPAFPPINRSLYKHEKFATKWECLVCKNMNDLPPPVPKELAMVPIPRPPLVCTKCNTGAPRIAVEARPTDWLRPRDIRDDVTLQIGGAPWTIFREDPRSDDVRQGALGNCWFVGALSVAAERPELIRNMFLAGSDEINPNAAYQLRLCRDGHWYTVLVDDTFPCTNLDMLAYSKASRRQLWVPLVEKAAAKLFGCYQHLSSGTLSEALTLFTGFPTEQISLGGAGGAMSAPAAADAEAAAAHAAAVKAAASEIDEGAIWQQLIEAKEKGFIMGTACVKQEAKDMKLSAPHAYAVLDLREISPALRLVKLRNPWGSDTWSGDWGPHSSKWIEAEDLRRLLRPEREDTGVFWITWEDWRKYFATCEVCRVRSTEWAEVRQSGWLPSAVGLGSMVEFSCFTDTEVDIVIHQEGDIVRGNTGSHLCDLGFAIVRKDKNGTYELIEDTERRMQPTASKAVKLTEGTYFVIPLCFNQMVINAPRKYNLVTHSSQPLLIEKRECDAISMAEVVIQRTIKHGKRNDLAPNVATYVYHGGGGGNASEAGLSVVAENYADSPKAFCVDCNGDDGDPQGMVSSRGPLFCQDVIPAQSRALLLVLSPEEGAERYGWRMSTSFDEGHEEFHVPHLDLDDKVAQIHQVRPAPPLSPTRQVSVLPSALPSNDAFSEMLRFVLML